MRTSLAPRVDKIACEKAGILKRGVPGVVAQQEEAVLDVIAREAQRVGAPLVVWGQRLRRLRAARPPRHAAGGAVLDLPLPALIGRHQIANAGTAVAAALQLG